MLRSHVRRLVESSTKFLLPVIIITVLAGFGVTARAWIDPGRLALPPSLPSLVAQTPIPHQKKARPRNLSLQPDAFNFSRRVGQRFHTAGRELFRMSATLTINSQQHNLLISRRQDERGESVVITFQGRALPLAWDHERGGRDTGGGNDTSMRFLVERIALDSPDQFVLAQLRGASYYTVARRARSIADDGADGYTGQVYDIVRVSEPGGKNDDGDARRWRLFYINTSTGLIDKVVTEEDGAQVEAVFSEWREQDGEKIPARIRWTRQGASLMELTVNGVSYAPEP